MKKNLLCMSVILIIFLTIVFGSSVTPAQERELVTIEDRGTYFNVVLDYRGGASHREVGEELGRKILEVLPNYEEILDSALLEMSYMAAGGNPQLIEYAYQQLLSRTEDIKEQLHQEYKDELEGMASQFSGQESNIVGDGKLSIDEVFMLNLMPDIIRESSCSFLAVYGPRSATGSTLMAKLFDWNPGSQNQLSEIQAVTTYLQGEKSICVVGLLGWMIGSNGINKHGIFVGALDSGTGGPYSSSGKRSYSFDARYALENFDTLDAVLEYLSDPEKSYTYSHNYAAIDSTTAKVLENNVDNPALRMIRTEESELAPGINWELDNSIAAVNCFVLAGNYTNGFWWAGNSSRWNSYHTQLAAKGDTVTFEDMKEIASYFTGSAPGRMEDGDIYNQGTQQAIILDPKNFRMEVYFRPKGMGPLPLEPTFEVIEIDFGDDDSEDENGLDEPEPGQPTDPEQEPKEPADSDPVPPLPSTSGSTATIFLAGLILLTATGATLITRKLNI
ncbi:MAG: hypothetical protein GX890_09375 [Firmicutes bacterium]|nr:hypothetical protein [Bacillota bacterium]